MSIFAPTAVEHVQALAISLAIGLLIGIERERHAEPKAGLQINIERLFALRATVSYIISQDISSSLRGCFRG